MEGVAAFLMISVLCNISGIQQKHKPKQKQFVHGEAKCSIETNLTLSMPVRQLALLPVASSHKFATSCVTSNSTSNSEIVEWYISAEISCRMQSYKLAASDSTDTASKERVMQTSKQIARINDSVTYPLNLCSIPLKCPHWCPNSSKLMACLEQDILRPDSYFILSQNVAERVQTLLKTPHSNKMQRDLLVQ